MFSPYLENFTPAFCAEAPEAESPLPPLHAAHLTFSLVA